ncbi:MAG: hypothetical protein XD36_3049 [Halomonas sp. 54_146]|nr:MULTISPECIES: hypothetical protein [unclassified Halomonas]KUJ86526.1 MAG: hypothetical protein XD36_3049 [Halomonas sp. 54_146]
MPHLQRLGAEVNLGQLTGLAEYKDMLAENLDNWAQQERYQGVEGTLCKQIVLVWRSS